MSIHGRIGLRPENPSHDHQLTQLEKDKIEAARHSPRGGLRAIQRRNGYDFDTNTRLDADRGTLEE